MKTLLILSLPIATAFGGETIAPLKSENTDLFSYGLGSIIRDSKIVPNTPIGNDLILTLRNTGAKWIDIEGITADDFSLQDAKGKEAKLYLQTSPKGLAYDQTPSIQFRVEQGGDATPPWTLHFKSKPKAFVPFDLKIEGIPLRKNRPATSNLGASCYTGSTVLNAGTLFVNIPVTANNQKQQNPTISKGIAITEARKALMAGKFADTGLEVKPSTPDTDLAFWSVDVGVLTLSYSTKTRLITGLSYTLTDERPKSTRKTFHFEVVSFDSATGQMVLKTTTHSSRGMLHTHESFPTPFSLVERITRRIYRHRNRRLRSLSRPDAGDARTGGEAGSAFQGGCNHRTLSFHQWCSLGNITLHGQALL